MTADRRSYSRRAAYHGGQGGGLFVKGWHAACEENLQRSREAEGVQPVAQVAPQPINLFMNTPGGAGGRDARMAAGGDERERPRRPARQARRIVAVSDVRRTS